MNLFINIKILNIYTIFPKDITLKITLPKLESLSVVNSYELNYFRGLKSLREIYVQEWDGIIEIDEIFDPSKLLKLKIGSIRNKEFLGKFTNLRKLEIGVF